MKEEDKMSLNYHKVEDKRAIFLEYRMVIFENEI